MGQHKHSHPPESPQSAAHNQKLLRGFATPCGHTQNTEATPTPSSPTAGLGSETILSSNTEFRDTAGLGAKRFHQKARSLATQLARERNELINNTHTIELNNGLGSKTSSPKNNVLRGTTGLGPNAFIKNHVAPRCSELGGQPRSSKNTCMHMHGARNLATQWARTSSTTSLTAKRFHKKR